MDCPLSLNHDCGHYEDAGVQCTLSTYGKQTYIIRPNRIKCPALLLTHGYPFSQLSIGCKEKKQSCFPYAIVIMHEMLGEGLGLAWEQGCTIIMKWHTHLKSI